MTFYKPEHEGVQTDDEAIVYAERHVEDGDEYGYGYTHCDWCGDEWPCTTAALLHIIQHPKVHIDWATPPPPHETIIRRAEQAARNGMWIGF